MLSKDKLNKIRKIMPKITPKQFDKILTKGKNILLRSINKIGDLFRYVKKILVATTSPGMIVENEILMDQTVLEGLFLVPFKFLGKIFKWLLKIVTTVLGAGITAMSQMSYGLFGGTIKVFFGTVFSLLGAIIKSLIFMTKDIANYIIGLIFNLTPQEMDLSAQKKIGRLVEKVINTMVGTLKKITITFWNGGMNIVSYVILGGFSIFIFTSFILKIVRKVKSPSEATKATKAPEDSANTNFGGYFMYDPIFEQAGIFTRLRKNTVSTLNFVSRDVIGIKSLKNTKIGMLIALLFLISCSAILVGLYVTYNKAKI